ncbi:MAG: glycolate oxidase subunit GlcF [Burkholderiales bacterium]|nr:glycolate oxidase subunit GlcF [Burkholderiales bacterium]
MQTRLAAEFRDTREGQEAEAIVRKCVHCGFCLATCPTYQLLGDELDSPRGRIYLMKQVLEGAPVTRKTQLHLDRCLTCRNCETTCPSGVAYGRLVHIGRQIVDERVERPAAERLVHGALRAGLTSPLFGPAMALGRLVRPLLPSVLKDKVPPSAGARARRWPQREHRRKVLLLLGCVQPSMMPNIDSATARVLDAAGIQSLVADGAGCCGAVRAHLGDPAGGLSDARRNIDAWWPLVQGLTAQGRVEAIVFNASACGLQVKEYGQALAHDSAYADKAARVSALARDLSELLPDLVPTLAGRIDRSRGSGARRLAYHPPCTLQHGQRLSGQVEDSLRALGFEVSLAAVESHLCCGSAGTYSVLQPELAARLRERKRGHLAALDAQVVVSANIGCIQHLQGGNGVPVRHWIEVLDEALG